jgi:Aminotransferase class I and II
MVKEQMKIEINPSDIKHMGECKRVVENSSLYIDG